MNEGSNAWTVRRCAATETFLQQRDVLERSCLGRNGQPRGWRGVGRAADMGFGKRVGGVLAKLGVGVVT